jgi:hypothetical protein
MPPVMPAGGLTWAVIIATLVPLLVGLANAVVQSGKLGPLAVPAKVLPWVTIVGSFLTGVGSYISSAPAPFVLNSMALFMMLVAGGYSLIAGMTPGVVAHHFGWQVNWKRPAASAAPAQTATSIHPPPLPPAAN